MKKLIFALVISLLFHSAANAESMTVRFVDVGQGDCTIVQTGDKTVVVDVGPPSAEDVIKNELEDKSIALLVLTHPHEDHDANFEWVIENCEMEELWMPEYGDDGEDYGDLLRRAVAKGVKISYPNVGDTICMGESAITVLSAGDPSFYEDKNLWSIVLKIEYGSAAIIVMGDAEDINEYAMIDAGLDLQADVLRIGHHGSDTSTTGAFLEAVQPSYAVISCGRDNQYGHPKGTVLEALESAGVKVYRTDLDGTIEVALYDQYMIFKPN